MRKLPVYRVAEEMFELANAIADSLKDDEKTEHFAGEIISNAMLIQVKIAGAEGGQLYSLRMENAVLIKLAARDMLNAVICTEMFDMNNDDYVQLMRDKVEEFRLVFVDWIRGFDKSHDIPDNWGIRFDTSTPEQEKLEELMFDEEKFYDHYDEDDYSDWDDADNLDTGEDSNGDDDTDKPKGDQ